jgi:hypothetical protein
MVSDWLDMVESWEAYGPHFPACHDHGSPKMAVDSDQRSTFQLDRVVSLDMHAQHDAYGWFNTCSVQDQPSHLILKLITHGRK